MTTSAKTAFKTLLQDGNAATPELFTTVAEVYEIDPPEQVFEQFDATSHDSTAAEYISSFEDAGEINFSANYLYDATQQAVKTALGGAKGNFQICFPNFGARTVEFTANASNEQCTATTHGLTTGQPVRVASTTTLPDPLVAGTTYYARWVSADIVTLHTTNAGAVAGTGTVNITDTGTGTHTLRIGNRLSFAANVYSHKLASPLKDRLSVAVKAKLTGALSLS